MTKAYSNLRNVSKQAKKKSDEQDSITRLLIFSPPAERQIQKKKKTIQHKMNDQTLPQK